MQIALTKKLVDAMKIEVGKINEEMDPIYCWTASWSKVWSNSRSGDMLVLVNHATRVCVVIYEIKRKDLKNVENLMLNAIKNTLMSMQLSPEIIEYYFKEAGKVQFVSNNNKKATAWVNFAASRTSFYVARFYAGYDKVFNDLVGRPVNESYVNMSNKSKESFKPKDKMFDELEKKRTLMPKYKYKAFELSISLDLEIYKSTRKLIVPADNRLDRFHRILQEAYGWQDYHLYDFRVYEGSQLLDTLIANEFDDNCGFTFIGDSKLSDYLTVDRTIVYTYDMGDGWEHEIRMVSVHDDYNEKSPYLLEASGQTPSEDVGGFIKFRNAILNPRDPEHEVAKRWSHFWNPELEGFKKHPQILGEFYL